MGRWNDFPPEPEDRGGFWLDELTGEAPPDERPRFEGHRPVRDRGGHRNSVPVDVPIVVGRAELRKANERQRRRSRRRRLRGVVVFLVLIGLISGGAYGAVKLTGHRQPRVQAGLPVDFTVQPGEGSRQIGRRLEEAGVVDSGGRFRAVASSRGLDGALKPGEYRLETGMDVDTVIDLLVRGSNLGTPFTVPEGFTVDQIVDRIAATKRFSKATLQKALVSPSLEVPFRPAGVKTLEGLLFPQTYRIERNASATSVLQQMLDQLDTVMGRFDQTATPRHLSPYQVLIIASMVEREAKVPEDRAKIARVIYNRLARRKPLQIDATVQYALGASKPRLSTKDLQVASPYNTYLHSGLPPTPIASPGQASIEAAMAPANGPWLFYVLTDADGHHAFTSSASEFARLKDEARRKGLL
ncbi:MAG TPA: endolytic transglycosylase MltG [Actinomycetes bacterium]